MSSKLLDSIGLGSVDIAYFFIGIIITVFILIILIIVEISKSSKLRKRYNKFMQGKDCKSLENKMLTIFEENKFLRTVSDQNKKDIRKIYKNLEQAYQKVGLVKYDAFKEMGGKLSFSLVLLNDNNDGFIINSVHSSDGCYSYTKGIKGGECEISLGEEEKNALVKALHCNEKGKE